MFYHYEFSVSGFITRPFAVDAVIVLVARGDDGSGFSGQYGRADWRSKINAIVPSAALAADKVGAAVFLGEPGRRDFNWNAQYAGSGSRQGRWVYFQPQFFFVNGNFFGNFILQFLKLFKSFLIFFFLTFGFFQNNLFFFLNILNNNFFIF